MNPFALAAIQTPSNHLRRDKRLERTRIASEKNSKLSYE